MNTLQYYGSIATTLHRPPTVLPGFENTLVIATPGLLAGMDDSANKGIIDGLVKSGLWTMGWDPPGVGDSVGDSEGDRESEYGYNAMVDVLHSLVIDVTSGEKRAGRLGELTCKNVILVGQSLGGLVSLETARRLEDLEDRGGGKNPVELVVAMLVPYSKDCYDGWGEAVDMIENSGGHIGQPGSPGYVRLQDPEALIGRLGRLDGRETLPRRTPTAFIRSVDDEKVKPHTIQELYDCSTALSALVTVEGVPHHPVEASAQQILVDSIMEILRGRIGFTYANKR